MKPVRQLLVGLLLLTACNSHGTASPVASPTATAPSGTFARILCRTHRVQIQGDEQALTVDESAGDATAVAALRVKIRGDIAATRAIPGCNVDDLPIP